MGHVGFAAFALLAALTAPLVAQAAGGCPPPGPTPQPPCKTTPASMSYATCVTSPSFEPPIPTRIGATEFDPKAENPPGGASDGTKYAHNTKSKWRLLVNPNVEVIKPYYGYFQTEWGYD